MALPQHNAAADNQRGRGKADFIGPQQESDGGVPAGFQLPIGLHYDPAAEVVGDQYLLGFRQAQLPGQAGVFDRGLRRGSGAAVMPANQHYIAVALGNAGGDGANAHFRHQFDMDPGRRIDVFQVVNQLGQILDGIDVVMRRRGNQLDAGGSMPHPADNFIHLVTRQLPALPGLGSLRHFDLQVRGVDQVVGRNPEAARGHLLDGAVAGIAVGIRGVAVIILAALAGVAARPDAVHGNGHGFVGFLADGAERGGPGGKAPDNIFSRLHFRQRNRRPVILELQQAAQGRQLAALVVDPLAELLIRLPAVGPGGVLELGDSVGIPLVDFAVPPPLVHPARFQIQLAGQGLRRKGKAMPLQLIRRHGVQSNAGHPGGRPGKVLVNQILIQTDGLKNLRPPVALHRGNAHLGHYLEQALFVGLEIVFHGIIGIRPVQLAAFRQILHRVQSQIGIDRPGPIAQEQAEVMHFPGFSGLYHQADFGALALPDEVMVDGGGSQQAGNRRLGRVQFPVGQDDQGATLGNGLGRGGAQFIQSRFQGIRPLGVKKDGQGDGAQARGVQAADLRQFPASQQRGMEFQLAAVFRRFGEKIPLAADKGFEGSYQFLPDGVEGRIGHLREQLLEIVEQQLILFRQHRQRGVVAHRPYGLVAAGGHGRGQHPQFLVGIAKGPLPAGQFGPAGPGRRRGRRQVG